jgi:DNA-binding MarR family transcriptional regulator
MKLKSSERPKAPHAQTGELVLDEFLPYRLSILANTVSRAFARAYQERFGLTIPQWRVMAVLAQFPDLSANEVAGKTEMDKVTISRTVASMLKTGHLERRTDPSDRRRTILRLSPAGRRIHAQIVPLARDYEARLVTTLTETDLETLDRIVERLLVSGRALDHGA